mgnify:FL=1
MSNKVKDFKELLDLIGQHISCRADVGESLDGEMVIWTHLTESEDGTLKEFVEPDTPSCKEITI